MPPSLLLSTLLDDPTTMALQESNTNNFDDPAAYDTTGMELSHSQDQRESNLESVIYEIARVHFSDLLTRNNQEHPNNLLLRFWAFIDSQANKGLLPKDQHKRVLSRPLIYFDCTIIHL